MKDVKLKFYNVQKVSCRYLPPFFGYRENPAAGRVCPPPSGARVNDKIRIDSEILRAASRQGKGWGWGVFDLFSPIVELIVFSCG